ncbi:MAG TPA: hypothetical protein V6D48_18560 [Oculatellaceae cyanobacterium]
MKRVWCYWRNLWRSLALSHKQANALRPIQQTRLCLPSDPSYQAKELAQS